MCTLAADASAIFAERDREKRAKHYAGCTARDRAYHTFCLTTFGGLGPPETIAYFDHVFLWSASREVAAGLSRRDALHRRQCFYAAVHAALVRATAVMLLRHTATPPSGRYSMDAAASRAADAARTAAVAASTAAAAASAPLPAPPSNAHR